MKRKTRAFGLVVGLAILAASAFYGLHLAGTMLYVRAPWHFMASSTSLPKDELALDLRCPAALTWGETARIQLVITNLRAKPPIDPTTQLFLTTACTRSRGSAAACPRPG